MMLVLDGTDRARLVVGTVRGGSLRLSVLKRNSLESTLPILQAYVRRNRLALNRLKGIIVVPGPGHFSSLRETAVFANVLAWQTGAQLFTISGSVNVPSLRRKKRVARITPLYGQPPHITRPKGVI